MFKKILIANRGEIACRVIETARRLGILTVAVYSDADAKARHVRLADEAVHIGGAAASDSYLKADRILEAAKQTGAQAVHPGYGFLSENAEFAQSCAKAGIAFIGPKPDSILDMGLKDHAKSIMEKAGVPVVPGYQGKVQDPAHLLAEANKIGYPVLIKAVAGGGGKGMRLVEAEKDFAESLESCKREAKSAFGNDHVLIEKYIEKPRHIEMQVFGDSHGNAVHLFERDCSLQRRHQKVVEEAPAPGLRDDVRKALGEAAVKAVQALGYENAGTIEFIMDAGTQDFYFMEMNTRLQVEHPVTEMITGLDLVEWQLRVAVGEKLPLSQKEIKATGHAFEVRLYAEDPGHEFLPQTGRIRRFMQPSEARVDTGVEEGDAVSIFYDPMIAKLIVHGKDRAAAIMAMQEALKHTGIAGLRTNQEFLRNVFREKDFIGAAIDTGFIPAHMDTLVPENYGKPCKGGLALAAVYFLRGLNLSCHSEPKAKNPVEILRCAQDDSSYVDPWDSRDHWRMGGDVVRPLSFICREEKIELCATCHANVFELEWNGESFEVSFVSFEDGCLKVSLGGQEVEGTLYAHGRDLTLFHGGRSVDLHLFVHGSEDDAKEGEGRITAQMPGRIVSVMVAQGDAVEKDQPLLVMEAMKMEMTIRAGCAGVVEELPVSANDQVADGALLVSIKGEDAA